MMGLGSGTPRRLTATSVLFLGLSLPGCGPGPATPAPATGPATSEPAPPTSPPGSPTPTEDVSDQGTAESTRWLGDIPYDVFYDQPLQIAAENSTIVPVSTGSPRPAVEETPMPDAVSPPPGPADSPAAGASSAIDWGQIAPIEILEEETKQLRNRLTTSLQTVATFNSNVEAIANDGATLAALAAIIASHPGEVSWKDKAPHLRDLGHELFMKAEGSGRTSYNNAQVPFESIVTILNGGPAPDREVSSSASFSEIADRGEMMKRIKRSFDFLKAEVNTEARLKEETEAAIREGTVLAALGSLLRDHSYDSADEPAYQQQAQEFVAGSRGMVEAAINAEFSNFEAARNRVQNACNACHGEYAFGDEGL